MEFMTCNGAAVEYAASWDSKSESSIVNYGKAIDGTPYFVFEGSSDKYKTAYSNGTTTNYGEIVKKVCRTGDGIKEIWIEGTVGWFNDWAICVNGEYAVSIRGGAYSLTTNGSACEAQEASGLAYEDRSFRVILLQPLIEIIPNQTSIEITEGTENTFESLFTVTTADGGTATKTYTLNGELASATNNTSTLAVGTHTITCTATYNGMSDTATVTIKVNAPKPAYTKVEYTTPGTYTWTVPEGVTTIKVTVAGAGGGGGGACKCEDHSGAKGGAGRTRRFG